MRLALELLLIVFVREAHVSAEHELLMLSVLRPVRQFPLILFLVAINRSFWAPAFHDGRPVIIVVEDSTIDRIAPESIVAGHFNLCTSNGMGSANCSSHGPWILSVSVDVFDKNLFETI